MTTRKDDLFPSEQPFDDGDRLGQPLGPGGSAIEAQTGSYSDWMLPAPRPSCTRPPARQEVDRRNLTRDQHGMSEVLVQHIGGDPESCRRLCGANQSRRRRDQAREVIGHSERGIAQPLDPAGLCLPLGPRSCVPHVHAKTKRFHIAIRSSGPQGDSEVDVITDVVGWRREPII